MRQEKQLLLDEIQEHIDARPNFAIIQYSGITANTIADFRNDVAKMGGDVQMVPKRIFVKAAAAAGVEIDLKSLPGHIGLVFAGEDSVEMTKAVFQFKKDSNQALDVLGGRVDGKLHSAADIEMLSKLPGKDEMRAQLLGLLEAPMSQTVSVMNSLLTAIIYCLDEKSKQES